MKLTISKKLLKEANGDPQKAIQLSISKNKNKNNYKIQPIGKIERIYKFREIVDFQYNVKNSKFINSSFLGSITTGDLERIKQIDLMNPQQVNQNELDLIPPPKFSSFVHPFQYNYKQTGMTIYEDELGITRVHRRSLDHIKSYGILIGFDASKDSIPSSPSKELLKENRKPNGLLKECIEIIKELFEIEPIWQRRGIILKLDSKYHQHLRYALPYVSYSFRSGPWRANLIKFGIDPRSSPTYAKYQCEHFRLSNEAEANFDKRVASLNIHLSNNLYFDGVNPTKLRSFILKNITDADVTKVLKTSKFNDEPDLRDGWYDAVSLTKARKIIQAKLKGFVTGIPPDPIYINDIINGTRTRISKGSTIHPNTQLSSDEDDNGDDDDVDDDDELDDELEYDSDDDNNLEEDPEAAELGSNNDDETVEDMAIDPELFFYTKS